MKYKKLLASYSQRIWSNRGLLITALIGGMILTTFGFYSLRTKDEIKPGVKIAAFPVTVPNMQWGFAIDTLQVLHTEIASGQSLSDILAAKNIDTNERLALIEKQGKCSICLVCGRAIRSSF
ncbi:MAG: hypothetical protein R2795_04580 [Saprospiraceae bacterium]